MNSPLVPKKTEIVSTQIDRNKMFSFNFHQTQVCADQTNSFSLSSGDAAIMVGFTDSKCTFDYIQIEGKDSLLLKNFSHRCQLIFPTLLDFFLNVISQTEAYSFLVITYCIS